MVVVCTWSTVEREGLTFDKPVSFVSVGEAIDRVGTITKILR